MATGEATEVVGEVMEADVVIATLATIKNGSEITAI